VKNMKSKTPCWCCIFFFFWGKVHKDAWKHEKQNHCCCCCCCVFLEYIFKSAWGCM
jgi:hypothetical protein